MPASAAPVGPAPVSDKLARWTLQQRPPQTAEEHVGKLFAGRYLLRGKIGSGGMSTIYEAQDVTLGVRVGIKILRDDLPGDPVDRFRREAHVLAGLQHEHIARIIDRQDPDEGPRFLVTDYIDGINLSALRYRGPVPAAVVVQLGLQASAALAYAHSAGVIHRDIKPSNIMLVRHPGGDVFVRVIDFGIAKLTRGSDLAASNAPAGARRETRGDVVVGTAPYWCGHEGPRRDVYALALTLAELLTGEAPDASVDLAREHIPPALARCITAALRSDEIVTMDAFHAALREAEAQAPGEAEPERRRYVARILAKTPAAALDEAPDVVPRFAGRYIFAGDLGQGGMGRVRTAFDTVHQRLVALKTIHPRCAGMKNLEHRFRREARALAAIRHGGAPTLFDGGHEPEPYFTMEIVEGVTLAAALRQSKKIDPPRALSLAIDLAGILCAAHDVGVIHRDVKPDNIVIEQGDRVRLLDFGACLLMPRFHQRHLLFPATPTDERYATGDLEMVGTPGYTAPEVMDLQGGGAGPRSDVYSVCAVLYELLTGRRFADPAAGRTRRIERGEFAAALGPMADLLRSGTAREPGDRVWNMAELVRRLEIIRASFLRAQQRRKLVLAVALAVGSTAAIGAVAVRSYVDARTVSSAASIPTTASSAPPRAGPAQPVNDPPVVAGTQVDPPAAPALSASQEPGVSAPPLGPTDATKPPRAGPPALTAALVTRRLETRRERLRECDAPMFAMDLTITAGHAALASVNGMSSGDPVHACVRDQIRGLTFPRQSEPAEFSVTIDLGEAPAMVKR